MPIREDLKQFYRNPEWKSTRERILARANHCCEQCRVPNYAIVQRYPDYPGWWFLSIDVRIGLWPQEKPPLWSKQNEWDFQPFRLVAFDSQGKPRRSPRELDPYMERVTKIVLGIAHLNHTPGDDRDENLKALCQRCHLVHDRPSHRNTRATRKDSARPIFQLLGGAR